MTMKQAFVMVFIHLIVPIAGLFFYEWLCKAMKRRSISDPPFISLFFLFLFFGGWLMILLTLLFWKWSGMASLGFFFLVFISPLISVGISIYGRMQRKISSFHEWVFLLSTLYGVLIIGFDIVWITSWYLKS